MSKNLVVRFAGEGGQGVVGGAELMASAAAQGGYHVLTFSTFPSQIKGGPAWGQARISSEPILTPGDYLDVLVAQNQYAYDHNIEELREGGIVVFNSEEFEIEDGGRALGLPADKMAREAGNPLASTIILIGAVAKMAGVDASELAKAMLHVRQLAGEAQKGNPDAAETFSKLGIDPKILATQDAAHQVQTLAAAFEGWLETWARGENFARVRLAWLDRAAGPSSHVARRRMDPEPVR